MRVCMVTPHLPPDQTANALLPTLLARELVRSGHHTTLLTYLTARRSRPNDLAVIFVSKRGRGLIGRTLVGAATAAARIGLVSARAFRNTDLVHLHSNGLIVEVTGWVAARRAIPVVLTLYGTDVWHFDPVRHSRFARVVRQAAQRVFYSQALRDRAIELGLADARSPVVYAPVDYDFQVHSNDDREATRKQLGADGPLLLTVKRLHPVAGHEDLLRAFARLVPRVPQIRLCIVGEGELRPDLERLARTLGVAGQVRFLGLVENRDLPRYYAAADLFVLPSRLESWGTVMIEALACGTRVVATDTAGATEAQGYFKHDLVLAARDAPQALAARIERELLDPRRVRVETLQQIESMFRPASCVAAYRAIYEAALGR